MVLPYGDPRKRWWTLMGGGQGAPLSPRFTQGALSQWFGNQQGIGPNYGNVNDQSDTITAATNNAAINAAMARQSSPVHSSVRGGPGSPLYGRSGPMAGKKGLSMKNMIKALTEMKKPPDQAKAGAWKGGEARPQLPGPAPFTPVTGVNPSIMNTGGLPGARNKKWWEIMGYS